MHVVGYNVNMKRNKKQLPGRTMLKINKRILSLGLLILIIAIFFSWTVISRKRDSARFNSVEVAKQAVVDRMVTQLGPAVRGHSTRNECFNTEQGPYDDGRLWCQTASIVQLHEDIPYDKIGAILQSSAQAEGLKVNTFDARELGKRYVLEMNHGMNCALGYHDAKGIEIDGGVRYVLTLEDAAPALSLSCADRAKAKHYQYDD